MNSHEKNKRLEETRNRLVSFAQLAERCHIYEDMQHYIISLIEVFLPINSQFVREHEKDLLNEEKNLFNAAFKTPLASRRRQWRLVMEKLQDKSNSPQNQKEPYSTKVLLITKHQLEEEIKQMCNKALEHMGYLIEKAMSNEGKAFYYKMSADYKRYKLDFDNEGDELEEK